MKLNRRTEGLIETDAIAFYKPFPLKKMGMGSLLRYIVSQIRVADIIILSAAMLAVTLIGMLLTKLNATLFKDVLESGSTRVLLGMGIFLVCATISSTLFNAIKSFASGRISMKLNVSVEGATMMRVLSLPAGFFRGYSAGELSSRVEYMSQLSDQLVNMVLSTGLTSLFSLSYVAQILHYAPGLVVPSLGIILVTIVISVGSRCCWVRRRTASAIP